MGNGRYHSKAREDHVTAERLDAMSRLLDQGMRVVHEIDAVDAEIRAATRRLRYLIGRRSALELTQRQLYVDAVAHIKALGADR
jgi:hypothetical protein